MRHPHPLREILELTGSAVVFLGACLVALVAAAFFALLPRKK